MVVLRQESGRRPAGRLDARLSPYVTAEVSVGEDRERDAPYVVVYLRCHDRLSL